MENIITAVPTENLWKEELIDVPHQARNKFMKIAYPGGVSLIDPDQIDWERLCNNSWEFTCYAYIQNARKPILKGIINFDQKRERNQKYWIAGIIDIQCNPGGGTKLWILHSENKQQNKAIEKLINTPERPKTRKEMKKINKRKREKERRKKRK